MPVSQILAAEDDVSELLLHHSGVSVKKGILGNCATLHWNHVKQTLVGTEDAFWLVTVLSAYVAKGSRADTAILMSMSAHPLHALLVYHVSTCLEHLDVEHVRYCTKEMELIAKRWIHRAIGKKVRKFKIDNSFTTLVNV